MMAISDKPTPWLYMVFDPKPGIMYGSPSMDGVRSLQFAANVGGVCVRVPAEQAIKVTGDGGAHIEWRHVG